MENNLKGVSLVNKLNSKRNKGIIEAVEFNSLHNDICIKLSEYKNGNGEWQFADRVCENFKDFETAQYTALAVNNFANLVDVLSEVKMAIELTNGKNTSIVEMQLNKINQALNNIKL